jgi:hypothetical protein
MLKMTFLVQRADGVSHDQLAAHWLDVHAPGVREHMRPDHYSVTIFAPRAGTPFDGMALLWWADHELGPRMFENAPRPVADDGFVPLTGDFVRMDSTEHVIVDGPRPASGVKLVFPVAFRPGVDHDAARAYWLDVHAPLVAASVEATPGAHRYVVTQADDSTRGRYAGIAELWYDDTAAARAQGEILERDDFGDYAEVASPLVGTEHVIIP